MRFSTICIAVPIGSVVILLSLLVPHVLDAGRSGVLGVQAAALTPPPSPGAPVSYARDWNIVAGPAGTVFSQANPILYTSQTGGGYTAVPNTQTVTQGWGYWAFFADDTAVTMNGGGVDAYATTLEPGQFKMVGNPSGTKSATVTADVIWTYDPAAGYTRRQGSATLGVGRGAWVYSAPGGAVTVTATEIATATPIPAATATPSLTATSTPTATTTPSPAATPTPVATATPLLTTTPTPTVPATPTPAPAAADVIRFAGTNNVGRDLNFDVKPDFSALTRFLVWYEVTCTKDMFGFGWEEYRWPADKAIEDRQFRIQTPAGGGKMDLYTGEFDATFSTVTGTWLKWLVVSDPPYSTVFCSNSGTWTASRQPK